MLLLAGRDFRDKWYHSKDFYLVSHAEEIPSRPAWQGRLALGTFIGMLALVVTNILPLSVAALLAAVFLVITRTITPTEARQMLDLRVLVVIAASFGIAAALENSGLARFLAQSVVQTVRQYGVLGALAGVYFLTSAYSTVITSNATAAILFPVGITAAASMQADPRPFAMAVALAAALSFATPISYQTNLMVYGPGGYKFKDFLKIGLPLQLLLGTVAVMLLYWRYF
ncbi:MAG: SLC13 family permease [candidate division KSB1 bacterium]|nr:SLC13 family permease [candidate division KSB1 bacterium]